MGHYFSTQPAASRHRRTVEFQVHGRRYTLATAGGVFSADRLDPGTAVLLRKAPPPGPETTGDLLDLGCGYGPIACTVAARDPQTEVWAIDVNRRARELCRLNARTLGLEVRVEDPDEVPAEVRFRRIVSNPPIRIGKAALHRLLTHWLDRLTDDGEAWLVVNRNLGADSLATWLVDHGYRVERVRSRQGYRILRVQPA